MKRQKPKGSGRKKGQLGAKQLALRAVSAQALLEGVTPLEVMLRNMRFYHEQADGLLERIVAGVEGKLTPVKALELMTLMKDLGSMRMRAQSCAVDAAKYCHPSLSSITLKPGEGETPKVDAKAAYENLVEVLDNVAYTVVDEPKPQPQTISVKRAA